MSTIAKLSAGFAALIAVAPVTLVATAHADDDAVFFSKDNYNCAILANGTIGCDRPVLTTFAFSGLPVPYPQSPQVIADPWVHDGFDYIGKPYTLPGGNPSFEQVANSTDRDGRAALAHAGRVCGLPSSAKSGFTCGTPSDDGGWESGQFVVLR
ncbi:hypothetical protein ABZ942_13055 [Nocardia sp. NPDC046473]|uniref:hypothetical protein n=1 Tax=Nocardia sp. NPDC046473 TaxID=3155733 RepID=UPI00340BE0C4